MSDEEQKEDYSNDEGFPLSQKLEVEAVVDADQVGMDMTDRTRS